MKKIAIVTPELVGLYKNGGIGTNYFFRARFLRGSLNYQITILYTGSCSAIQADAWRERHGQTGIRLEILPEIPAGTRWEMFVRRVAAVHQWLTAQNWDEIHFPEYLGNGFMCLQAKRAGLAYLNTRLVVTMHSSSRWCREVMQWDSLDPETDTKLDYAERYSCENADTVISPSRYMVQWAEHKGWRLPADTTVLPSLYEKLEHEDSPPSRLNHRHLIFFGRLETRKGLEIFCEAVTRLVQTGQAPARVDFLGKVGTHENQPADQYIHRMCAQWPGIEVQIHTDLDCFAAMQHIRRTGGLAVIASLRDNLPYTVIECIINQTPFIASNTGGIPELADLRVLFAPDAHSLAAKLKEFAKLPPETNFNHPYRIETTRAAWEKFAATPFEITVPSAVAPPPKLSVCVPYYNHGKYLPAALAALARQTYGNFEVIVVDDGSTAADAQESFETMRQKYAGPQFRFFQQENAGVGAARNFAASQASGEYLVFVDADNVPMEQMLAVFAHALQFSAADCATCHMAIFYNDAELEKPPNLTHAPLGPCLEVGWRVNLFGDANFIVTKKVFTQLGGFATDRSAVEDWQFLVRLTFRGFHQIVIPEILYWYRFLPDSMMRQTDEIRFTRTILETYREGVAFWPASILENYVFQPYQSNVGSHTIATRHATLASRQPASERRRRGKFLQKLQRSTVKRLLEFAGFVSRL
jgi:glycosyltransferase involved in cell wall biosynthesis